MKKKIIYFFLKNIYQITRIYICIWYCIYSRTWRYLVFFYVKALAFRHKWKAHAGESTHDNSNILFSVKQSHPLQIKKQINIYLANKFKKKEPDFLITGAYTSLSFKVYEGRRLIAEVLTNSFSAYKFLLSIIIWLQIWKCEHLFESVQ